MRDPAVFHPLPIFRCLLATGAYFSGKKHDMVMNGDYVSCYKNGFRILYWRMLKEDERQEKDLVPLHAQRSALADG
ncbi:MAG TPA: hypothetical protein VF393_03870 [archaeon]